MSSLERARVMTGHECIDGSDDDAVDEVDKKQDGSSSEDDSVTFEFDAFNKAFKSYVVSGFLGASFDNALSILN